MLVSIAVNLLGSGDQAPFFMLPYALVPIGFAWMGRRNYIETAPNRVRVVGRGRTKIDCPLAEARFEVPREPDSTGFGFVWCSDGTTYVRCSFAAQGQMFVPRRLQSFLSRLDELGIDWIWTGAPTDSRFVPLSDLFGRRDRRDHW